MAFIGLILLAGLFSLQFALMGPRSENIVTQKQEVKLVDTMPETKTVTKVEVVYLCPSDTVLMARIERAKTLLL